MWGTLRDIATQVQKETLSGLATANDLLEQLDSAIEEGDSDENEIIRHENDGNVPESRDTGSIDIVNEETDEFDESQYASGGECSDDEVPKQVADKQRKLSQYGARSLESPVQSSPKSSSETRILQENISELTVELGSTQFSLSTEREKNNILDKEKNALTEKLNRLKAEHKEMNELLKEVNERNEVLRIENIELISAKSRSLENEAELESLRKLINQNPSSTSFHVDELHSRISSLEAELSSERSANESMTSSAVDELHGRISSLEAELSSERSANESMTSAVDELHGRIESLVVSKNELEFELQQLRNEFEEGIVREVGLKQNISNLQQQISFAERNHKEVLSALEDKVRVRDSEITKSLENLKSLTMRCASLDSIVADGQARLARADASRVEAESELVNLSELLSKVEVENSRLQQKVLQMEDGRCTTEKKNRDLEDQLNVVSQSAEKFQRCADENQVLRTELSEALLSLEKQDQKKKRDLDSLRKQNERVALLQREHEAETNDLKSQVERLTSVVALKDMELQEFSLSSAKFSSVVKEQEEAINELQSQLAEAESRLEVEITKSTEASCLQHASADSDEEGSFVVVKQGKKPKLNEETGALLPVEGPKEIALLKSHIVDLEKRNSSATMELDEVKLTLLSREAYINELQDERERLEEENREMFAKMSAFQNNHESFDARISGVPHPRQRGTEKTLLQSSGIDIELGFFDEDSESHKPEVWGIGSPPPVVAIWNIFRSFCPSILRLLGDRPPSTKIVLISYVVFLQIVIGFLYFQKQTCFSHHP